MSFRTLPHPIQLSSCRVSVANAKTTCHPCAGKGGTGYVSVTNVWRCWSIVYFARKGNSAQPWVMPWPTILVKVSACLSTVETLHLIKMSCTIGILVYHFYHIDIIDLNLYHRVTVPSTYRHLNKALGAPHLTEHWINACCHCLRLAIHLRAWRQLSPASLSSHNSKVLTRELGEMFKWQHLILRHQH